MRLRIQNRKAVYKTGALAGFVCATAFIVYVVFSSSRSTASIGLLFVPVYGSLAAAVGWALVHIVFAFLDLRSGKSSWWSKNVLAAAAFLSAFILLGIGALIRQSALSIADNPNSTPAALEEIFRRWIPLDRKAIDAALAKNPSTPSGLLETMVESGNNYLVQLVGANAKTPSPILERIASGPLTYDRVTGLATNERISPAIMDKLMAVSRRDFPGDLEYKLYQESVLASLARNPAVPQEVFDRLASRDSPAYFLVVAILYAPKATCAQISRFLVSDNQILRNTAGTQLRERGCSTNNSSDRGR